MQVGSGPRQDGTWTGVLDLGPYVFAIYPEYLTDPNIVFCPSDAELADAQEKSRNPSTGDWCFGYAEKHGGKCARAVDASYAYWGWMFDQSGYDDPRAPLDSFAIVGLITPLLQPDEIPTDLSIPVPIQVVRAIEELVAPGGTLDASVLTYYGGGLHGFHPNADKDAEVGAPYGNGGGSRVYRLREGIERFMITDINNPGAAAAAQSDIFIMFDQLSTVASGYNHIPGGSNVLYMDGHCEFLRYEQQGDGPVNEPLAVVGGLFNGG